MVVLFTGSTVVRTVKNHRAISFNCAHAAQPRARGLAFAFARRTRSVMLVPLQFLRMR